MRVHDVALTVRRTLDVHHAVRGPDELGRVWCCSCGHWEPTSTWAAHLLDVLDDAGLQLIPKEQT